MAKKTRKKEPRKINKQELLSLVSAKSGLTKAQTRKALNGITDIIKEALEAGNSVSLVNFGSFKPVNGLGQYPGSQRNAELSGIVESWS